MKIVPRFALTPNASVAELDGEAVVLHLRTGRFFRVNASGTAILATLKVGPASREQLVDALCSRYDVDAARAGADVDAFTAMLLDGGLLTPTDASVSP